MNIPILHRLNRFVRHTLVRRVLEEDWSIEDAAHAANVSIRTVYKWLKRFREEGQAGLSDRSSRPHRIPKRTPREQEQQILALRLQRHSAARIAREIDVPRSTVSAVLARHGLGRLKALDPKLPPRRYEHPAPGDMLHLDVKKLAAFGRPGHRVNGDRSKQSRGVGWEYVHVCIDDYSRAAYVEILPDETVPTATAFFQRALKHFEGLGITVRRLLTDNGGCYKGKDFKKACNAAGVKHRFTRPYTPRTNGKAERFIQTMLKEWAYVRSYDHSLQRQAALGPWLKYYNEERIHGTIGTAPVARLPAAG